MDFETLKIGARIQLTVEDNIQSLTAEQIRPSSGNLKNWQLKVARLFIDGGPVRFRDDGAGDPTPSDGDVLNDGDYWYLVGESIGKFKVISENGTVKVNITPFYSFGH